MPGLTIEREVLIEAPVDAENKTRKQQGKEPS